MGVSRKKLSEQVVVVTGASSGIGLATARAAARRGARVVLVARDEYDLRAAADSIRAAGGRAMYVSADVADFDDVARVAERAVDAFGGIDTWVNNAGVTIYGRIGDVPLADARRLFETNYWGVVHGSLVAVPHLKRGGGVLINVGSVLSDTTMPLQGHYAASKHAVKGFTDALRIELEEEGAPVAVVLVKPAAIDTPYPEHAGNHLGVEPKHQAPVYAPDLVAAAILDAAERPRRDVKVGGSAKVFTTLETFAPRLADKFKQATSFTGQRSDQPAHSESTLYAPRAGDGRERGNYPGHVRKTSTYTTASRNPVATVLGAAALGLGVAFVARNRDRDRDRE
jgi:NAD(P)-dependent dehydrogenase (short-subunit alcohol dehydrogenase family)